MAVVVEGTSGMPLSQFMQEKIFDPLGMKDTGFRFRPGWRERMAECVRHKPDGTVEHCEDLLGDPLDTMYREDGKYEAADAGLISSLHDLQTFSAMLANKGTLNGERIIGRKTIDMMRQNLLDDALMKEFQNVVGEASTQTATNLPPRLRMTTLYAVSQSVNGRVVNTCNLSEDWVGYSTLRRLSQIFLCILLLVY